MLRKRLILPSFVFFVIAFVAVALFLRADRAFAQTAPPANFKVAFIGDSGAGSNFQKVLDLIKAEGADMVLHQGDFSYDGTSTWINRVDSTLGSNFPYLGSVGNHDTNNWGDMRSGCTNSTFAGYFKCKLQKMGVTPELSNHDELYAVTYKGLRIVFANENPGSTGANWVNQKLSGDSHIWKICSWHKNQNAMQVGGKGNSVGWDAYENCRKQGAIVATGHEHSYERTKTLTSTTNQTVDSSCSGRNNLCVAPGKTFVFVAGTGGAGLRNQDRCLPTTYPYGCKGEWASIYTTDQGVKHGALFIEFNIGGNPNRAHGYFKNVNGQVIDDFYITKGGSAPTGGPTSTPIPTNSPTPTPTPKASPTPFPSLSFEAESGNIASPFTVTSGYVSQPIGGTNPTTGGRASYRFNITDQGDYLVKAVVNASSTGSNSFFINIDGEPTDPYMVWDIDVTSGFEERTVSWRGNGTPDVSEFNPKVFTLTSGEHELVIRGREQDTRIDRISIVKNVQLPTSTTTPTATPYPTSTITSIPTAQPLPGDINGDGVVNILDFQILSNNFGTSDLAADLNNDGIVNILDFQILSNNFG